MQVERKELLAIDAASSGQDPSQEHRDVGERIGSKLVGTDTTAATCEASMRQ